MSLVLEATLDIEVADLTVKHLPALFVGVRGLERLQRLVANFITVNKGLYNLDGRLAHDLVPNAGVGGIEAINRRTLPVRRAQEPLSDPLFLASSISSRRGHHGGLAEVEELLPLLVLVVVVALVLENEEVVELLEADRLENADFVIAFLLAAPNFGSSFEVEVLK